MSVIKWVIGRAFRFKVVRLTALAGGAAVALVIVANFVLWRSARGHVVSDVAELSGEYDAVIVPGAGVFANERPSLSLQSRIDAAVELHELGIVDHILASGDNATEYYDEPTAIRRSAHQLGVPLADITLDYAGFSTWQTCVRAKEIFGVERAVFVTQARYANRAAALCQAAGVDADVLSIGNLGGLPVGLGWRLAAREPIAAVKGLYEMVVRPEPTFLGDYVGLVGSQTPANPDPALGE
ncbi:MAG: SanA/YdcF family protein [Acidimicrobiales bacterium]